jgi:hypothetical protein
MLSADENSAGGKPAQRNQSAEQPRAKSGQRRRKSVQKHNREPDQLMEAMEAPTETIVASEPIAPVTAPIVASDPIESPAADAGADVSLATAETVPVSYQALANAYGDYTRKSFEQTRSFFEKLGRARSLDSALELQVEFTKQAWDTFIAGSQKIRELHRGLSKQSLAGLEGLVTKMTDCAPLLRAKAR